MLKLKKGEPWVFWPSSICDTFPENPGNKVLRGDCYFEFEIKFTLNELSNERMTLFSLLPKYTGLDIHPNGQGMTFVCTTESTTEYVELPMLVNIGKETTIKLKHLPKDNLSLFINGTKVYEEDLTNKVFGIDSSPHIIFGAGNFPKNNFNLNYVDLDLHEFILKGIIGTLSHHIFEEFIFDKSIDISGNLNFIHKI